MVIYLTWAIIATCLILIFQARRREREFKMRTYLVHMSVLCVPDAKELEARLKDSKYAVTCREINPGTFIVVIWSPDGVFPSVQRLREKLQISSEVEVMPNE